MAAGSLLALIDDITSVLDDIATMTKVASGKAGAVADDMATMTKVATQKTAGVLGDDLALNAQQVTGVAAERELPVVWAVLRGSLVNKAVLVPLALLISAFAAWAITPLLMVGGLFLSYEGAEKVLHWLKPVRAGRGDVHAAATAAPTPTDVQQHEKTRVRGAVRTDFILSAEIVALALGTVTGKPLLEQLGVLAAVALVVTFGVYGIVAGIVKLDDVGAYLQRIGRTGGALQALGRRIVLATPWLMRGLSVLGTIAMFVVGGGILVHGVHALAAVLSSLLPHGGWTGALLETAATAAIGLCAGSLVLLVVEGMGRARKALGR